LDIRLVAMDLDGTLLNVNRQISPENVRALRLCEQKGIKMVMASGRGYESVRRLALEAGLNSPMITSNGARVDMSPDGPMLADYPFEPELARQVYEIMLQSGIYFVLYARNGSFRSGARDGNPEMQKIEDKATQWIKKIEGMELMQVDADQKALEEALRGTYKFAAFTQDEPGLAALKERLKAETPCSLSSSWFDNVEVMRPGAGKSLALEDLARKLDIKQAQIMAFGDHLNDLDMLESVGMPVAMENAVEPLKRVARHIAPHHDQSGVGQVLRSMLLGEHA
jgi:Cof subfamily protein (haloacid dehalogenase superfamily)